jgi:hypothetical protein
MGGRIPDVKTATVSLARACLTKLSSMTLASRSQPDGGLRTRSGVPPNEGRRVLIEMVQQARLVKTEGGGQLLSAGLPAQTKPQLYSFCCIPSEALRKYGNKRVCAHVSPPLWILNRMLATGAGT